jgi:hypothetical protein
MLWRSAPLALAIAAMAPSVAHADGTIRIPGDHPDYHVDIEPHGVLAVGFDGFDGIFGFGGGVRFSIPVCKNCFIPRINNNVAITFGADFAYYPFPNNYQPTFLFLPVALQWNFFVDKKWSVGPEVGFTPWFGLYNYAVCDGNGCHNWELWPSIAAVGRYHFNQKVALTMRLGFPEFFNIGVSFWL